MDFIVAGFIRAIELLVTGDPATWSAVFATLKVSAGALLISTAAGLPCGFLVGYFDFRGKKRLYPDGPGNLYQIQGTEQRESGIENFGGRGYRPAEPIQRTDPGPHKLPQRPI